AGYTRRCRTTTSASGRATPLITAWSPPPAPSATKIRERCSLSDRFLLVRGDIRTYKIHLGSGNILMEPNDQYLCIVPSRSTAPAGDVLLPFEGDATLSIILSKAFLLAEDRRIRDETIVRQISPK